MRKEVNRVLLPISQSNGLWEMESTSVIQQASASHKRTPQLFGEPPSHDPGLLPWYLKYFPLSNPGALKELLPSARHLQSLA